MSRCSVRIPQTCVSHQVHKGGPDGRERIFWKRCGVVLNVGEFWVAGVTIRVVGVGGYLCGIAWKMIVRILAEWVKYLSGWLTWKGTVWGTCNWFIVRRRNWDLYWILCLVFEYECRWKIRASIEDMFCFIWTWYWQDGSLDYIIRRQAGIWLDSQESRDVSSGVTCIEYSVLCLNTRTSMEVNAPFNLDLWLMSSFDYIIRSMED